MGVMLLAFQPAGIWPFTGIENDRSAATPIAALKAMRVKMFLAELSIVVLPNPRGYRMPDRGGGSIALV